MPCPECLASQTQMPKGTLCIWVSMYLDPGEGIVLSHMHFFPGSISSVLVVWPLFSGTGIFKALSMRTSQFPTFGVSMRELEVVLVYYLACCPKVLISALEREHTSLSLIPTNREVSFS